MVLASVIAALLVVSVPLICLSSRARARREVQGVVQVGTTEYTLPALVWSLWNFGDPHALAKALSSRGTHSLTGVRDALTTLLQTIPPEQSTAIAALADESERAHSDYLLWQAQREGLSAALGVGAADAFILALGENADWASSILDSITENTEIAEAVLGAVVPKLGRAFFRELTPDLYEAFLEKAAPVLLDSVEAAGDATLEGAALIADTHLPLATIGFALYRAKQASEAGLEGERVAENAAWDIGAKGGGVATGAAIGTFILPGIGTLAGGILGSLLGKGIADRGKARHLNRAQREAAESLTTLGQRVSRHEWLSISRRLKTALSMRSTHSKPLGSGPAVLSHGGGSPAIVGLNL